MSLRLTPPLFPDTDTHDSIGNDNTGDVRTAAPSAQASGLSETVRKGHE